MASKAHSLNTYYRVVGTEGRISGTWVVILPPTPGGTTLVIPHEVTIYDEGRNSGIVLSRDALTAWVRESGIEIPYHMIRESVRPDVLDVWDELVTLIADIAVCAGATNHTNRTQEES